jgi:hypothetical protein
MDTFDVLIVSFFDVLITFINLFDVVILVRFFDVLFGFQRCEIRSSDLFPESSIIGFHLMFKVLSETRLKTKAKSETFFFFFFQ